MVNLEGKILLEQNMVIQGDCLEVMRLIDDKSIDMILTDLPYGKTQNVWEEEISLEFLWKQYKRIIKDNGMICLTAMEPFTSRLIMSNLSMFRYDLIWDKKLPSGFLNANKMPLRRHEQILCFYRKLPTYHPQMEIRGKIRVKGITTESGKHTSNYGEFASIMSRNNEYFPTSIITIGNTNRLGSLHPTQKPLALFEYLIATYTNEEDLVLDNCAGSGTTGIACKNLKRNYILIEKSPEYAEIARRRLQEYGRLL